MLRPPKTMEGTIIWKMYLLPRESSKYSKYARAGNSTIPPPRPPPSMPVTSRRLLMSFIFTRGSKEKPSLNARVGGASDVSTVQFSRETPNQEIKNYSILLKKISGSFASKTLPIIYRQNYGLQHSKQIPCNRQIPQEVQPLLKDGSLKNLTTGYYRPPTSRVALVKLLNAEIKESNVKQLRKTHMSTHGKIIENKHTKYPIPSMYDIFTYGAYVYFYQKEPSWVKAMAANIRSYMSYDVIVI